MYLHHCLSRLRFSMFTLLALLTLSALPLHAGTLHVGESGTFDSTTPASWFTSPDGSFSFSFDVDASPTIANSATGYFAIPFANFNYALNGTSVFLPTNEVDIFADPYGGLFDVCLDSSCTLGNLFNNGYIFSGPQIYTGNESAPTLLTGTFTPSFGGVVVDGNGYLLASQADVAITGDNASITPEPSSLFLLGTGLLAIAGTLKRRFC